MAKKGDAVEAPKHQSRQQAWFTIKNLCSHFTTSVEVASSVMDVLMDRLGYELAMRAVTEKIQPFGIDHTLACCLMINMHEVQTYD